MFVDSQFHAQEIGFAPVVVEEIAKVNSSDIDEGQIFFVDYPLILPSVIRDDVVLYSKVVNTRSTDVYPSRAEVFQSLWDFANKINDECVANGVTRMKDDGAADDLGWEEGDGAANDKGVVIDLIGLEGGLKTAVIFEQPVKLTKRHRDWPRKLES